MSAADIDELLGVDGAVEDVDAGNEPVAEAADDAVVGDLGKPAVVLVAIVEPLEDRMHQMAVDPKAPKSMMLLSSRMVVLLAMRTVSMLRCQSLITLSGPRAPAWSAQCLRHGAGNALPHSLAFR